MTEVNKYHSSSGSAMCNRPLLRIVQLWFVYAFCMDQVYILSGSAGFCSGLSVHASWV